MNQETIVFHKVVNSYESGPIVVSGKDVVLHLVFDKMSTVRLDHSITTRYYQPCDKSLTVKTDDGKFIYERKIEGAAIGMNLRLRTSTNPIEAICSQQLE